jgi:serine/threonine-protein kinase
VIAKRAAIKILHPELSANREAVERFVQEARAVNQIGHPNIVDIFAFGQMPDGRSFFVMEWLRGESLRERTDREPLPMADALAVLDTISLALEAAHEAGIVHRDLKPDNVFLVETKADRPQVKLLDFGIAKLLNTDAGRTERTRTGNLLGTPAYISPEQARGYTVDHRTDIYAFGALAYELFTGALPFPADNLADMIAKQLFQPPPSARELCPDVTPALDQLLQSMLAKLPDQRPSLATAREELRAFRQQVAFKLLGGGHSQFDTFSGGRTEPDVELALRNRYHTPPPGSMQYHTPPPGSMQYQTPPPGSVQYQTPPPGALSAAVLAQSISAVPAGPTSMPMEAPRPTMTTTDSVPAPTSSRKPIVVLSAIAALGIGVAVFFALGRGPSKEVAAPVESGKLEPAVDPAKAAAAKAADDAKAAADAKAVQAATAAKTEADAKAAAAAKAAKAADDDKTSAAKAAEDAKATKAAEAAKAIEDAAALKAAKAAELARAVDEAKAAKAAKAAELAKAADEAKAAKAAKMAELAKAADEAKAARTAKAAEAAKVADEARAARAAKAAAAKAAEAAAAKTVKPIKPVKPPLSDDDKPM